MSLVLVIHPLPILAVAENDPPNTILEETETTDAVKQDEEILQDSAETDETKETLPELFEPTEQVVKETTPTETKETGVPVEETTENESSSESMPAEDEPASEIGIADPEKETSEEHLPEESLEGITSEEIMPVEADKDVESETAMESSDNQFEIEETPTADEPLYESSAPELFNSNQEKTEETTNPDEVDTKEISLKSFAEEDTETESQEDETESEKETTEKRAVKKKEESFLLQVPSIPEYYPAVNLYEEFRFTQIKNPEPILLKAHAVVYTDTNIQSAVVAVSYGQNSGVRIQKVDANWSYIETGCVRGFVRNSEIITGKLASYYWKQLQRNGDCIQTKAVNSKSRSGKGFISEKICPMDNPALTYTRTTANDVIVAPSYGIAEKDIQIRDSTAAETALGRNPQTVGTLKAGDLCCIIADVYDSNEWFVESGDVRGFVSKADIDQSSAVQYNVKREGEESFTFASEIVKPKDNRALYYSLASVKKARENNGRAVIEFALQFVGSPYVFGGNSLTNGIDCSGFVQQVYAHFGYRLPRTSANIRNTGKYIGTSLRNAQMGDIICYEGHVALYLGNGQIVHASNSKPYPRGGVKVSKNAAYRKILAIRRIIE